MSNPSAVEVVRQFWRPMATNDFSAVAQVLSPEFVLEWPQSKERISGAERFARMNSEYPAHGRWSFTINRLVGWPEPYEASANRAHLVERMQ